MARGTALVTIDKLYLAAQFARAADRALDAFSVTYYLNPKQVSDQASIFPQFEFINPLGIDHHRVPREPDRPSIPFSRREARQQPT